MRVTGGMCITYYRMFRGRVKGRERGSKWFREEQILENGEEDKRGQS